VLPQFPLTLTNAIIVTAVLSRQLFPHEIDPVNERNLALTMAASAAALIEPMNPGAVAGAGMVGMDPTGSRRSGCSTF
jgi:hypothetical protein